VIRFVIDASCVGPLVLPDEVENLMPGVIEALSNRECIAPPHWFYEVGNLALSAVRRKRTDTRSVLANLRDLADFAVDTDPVSSQQAWSTTYLLAEEHSLTIYDAAYLELAQRLALTLLSADKALIRAATTLGVRIASSS
jgi:predicted nucleic acid-binding protein